MATWKSRATCSSNQRRDAAQILLSMTMIKLSLAGRPRDLPERERRLPYLACLKGRVAVRTPWPTSADAASILVSALEICTRLATQSPLTAVEKPLLYWKVEHYLSWAGDGLHQALLFPLNLPNPFANAKPSKMPVINGKQQHDDGQPWWLENCLLSRSPAPGSDPPKRLPLPLQDTPRLVAVRGRNGEPHDAVYADEIRVRGK